MKDKEITDSDSSISNYTSINAIKSLFRLPKETNGQIIINRAKFAI